MLRNINDIENNQVFSNINMDNSYNFFLREGTCISQERGTLFLYFIILQNLLHHYQVPIGTIPSMGLNQLCPKTKAFPQFVVHVLKYLAKFQNGMLNFSHSMEFKTIAQVPFRGPPTFFLFFVTFFEYTHITTAYLIKNKADKSMFNCQELEFDQWNSIL